MLARSRAPAGEPSPPRGTGSPAAARLGGLLIGLGILLLIYAGFWQLGLAPGSRVTLPQPVALERAAGREARPTAGPVEDAPARLPTAPPRPVAPAPTAPPAGPTLPPAPLIAADHDDRAALLRPGLATRLVIPSISLDTAVVQAGVVRNRHGDWEWETRPFVAVHYGELTSLVGSGNAVIAGHVVTLREGNVFRSLYKVELGDQIEVWDDHDQRHDFEVVDVRLVPPSDTGVMAPTASPRLTLITCGGTFNPATREFSDRLVVIAEPAAPDS